MRLVAISDTHQQHASLDMPAGDVLIHAGDWTHRGRKDEIDNFLEWFAFQPHPHKILICGNHDMGHAADTAHIFCSHIRNMHYLEDSYIIINSTLFYGSPWTPAFFQWGFMTHSDAERENTWKRIPTYTDVLITHGPPFGYLDKNSQNYKCGDATLAKYVRKIAPKVHIFGHIHEAHGQTHINKTRLYNVASLDGDYKGIRKPTVIDIG